MDDVEEHQEESGSSELHEIVATTEPSIEDEIKDLVNMITLTEARLLFQKTKDAHCKLPKDTEPLNIEESSSIISTYEERMSKTILRKKMWAICAESSAVMKLVSQAAKDKAEGNGDDSNEFMDILHETMKLQGELEQIFKMQEEIALQIVARKEELQQKLHDYNQLLKAQKEEQQRRAAAEQEDVQLEEKLTKKLEKLNVMRMLMINLIAFSNVNYIKHPEWTDILLNKQTIVTDESLADM
ncbi:uncharacterized protein [Periplaneta americana]